MNQYKVEVKQVLKKEITVNAEDENKALDFAEKAYLKSDMLNLSANDLNEVELSIVEKNNKKIEKENIILDKKDIEYLEKLIRNVIGTLSKTDFELFELTDFIDEIKNVKCAK